MMGGIDLHAPVVDVDIWNLPDDEELIARPQWVSWQWQTPKGRDQTKVPLCSHRLLQGLDPAQAKASVTDPATWSTYSQAIGAGVRPLDGVGFVVTAADPFCGIDLDHCVDAETGTVADWVRGLVDFFNSYTERTPSGTGLRIWLRGRKPGAGCKQGLADRAAIEVYDRERFFTLTGFRLEGAPTTIEPRQVQLEALYAELWPPAPTPQPPRYHGSAADSEVLAKMFASKHGQKLRGLYEGNLTGYPSASEAEAALISHLGYWSDYDRAQTDALFRQSGLMRPKWDEKRGPSTYGQVTIGKVFGER